MPSPDTPQHTVMIRGLRSGTANLRRCSWTSSSALNSSQNLRAGLSESMSSSITPTVSLFLVENAALLKAGAMAIEWYSPVPIRAQTCARSCASVDCSLRSQARRAPVSCVCLSGQGRGNLTSAELLASLYWLPSCLQVSLNSSTGRPRSGAW